MPTGPRPLIDNCCYHIITRGNQRQRVFRSTNDYRAYLKRLKYYKRKYKLYLYGYCLMPNHTHLVAQVVKAGDLSCFMRCVLRSYTAYFNCKYKLVGHLWQGRFKSKVIAKDKYLFDCISYVEANPVRANLVSSICEYPWSSYSERVLGNTAHEALVDELKL